EMAAAGWFGESDDAADGVFAEDVADIEIAEEAPAASALALIEAEILHAFEGGYCLKCLEGVDEETKASKTPYGDVAYADPGYQSDKKKRYPIDSADHVRAAWSYI